jgi:hypothetical protein
VVIYWDQLFDFVRTTILYLYVYIFIWENTGYLIPFLIMAQHWFELAKKGGRSSSQVRWSLFWSITLLLIRTTLWFTSKMHWVQGTQFLSMWCLLWAGSWVPFHVVPFVSWFMGSFPCGAFCELVHGYGKAQNRGPFTRIKDLPEPGLEGQPGPACILSKAPVPGGLPDIKTPHESLSHGLEWTSSTHTSAHGKILKIHFN